MQQESYLYISYAPKNRDIVSRIVDWLQQNGFLLQWNGSADPAQDPIHTAAVKMSQCGLFVAFVSKAYFASQNCLRELAFAHSHRKEIFFVWLESCSLPVELRLTYRFTPSFDCPSSDPDEICLRLSSEEALQPFRAVEKNGEKYAFISYAHKNQTEVFRMLTSLQRDGFPLWYDDRLELTINYFKDIADHLEGCSLFLAFISKDYIASKNCLNELYYADKLGKNILFYYLEEVTMPGELEMNFGMLQAVLSHQFSDPDMAYKKLISSSVMQALQTPGKAGKINSASLVAFLIRVSDNDVIPLTEGHFYLGSDPEQCQCCIQNEHISGIHALIVTAGAISRIADMDPAHRTSINSESLWPRKGRNLRNGDVISLAGVEFIFRYL